MKFRIVGLASVEFDSSQKLQIKLKVSSLENTPSSRLIKELQFTKDQVNLVLIHNAKIPAFPETTDTKQISNYLQKLTNVEVEVEIEQVTGVRSSIGIVSKITKSSGVTVSPSSDEWPLPETISPFMPIAYPYLPDSQSFRLGYAIIKSPIQLIESTRNTYMQETSALRSDNSIKSNHGMSYQTYEMSYIATGRQEIYESVKEVFEQLAINPFICGKGGPFGTLEPGTIPTGAIAVRSFGVTTVPKQPESLQVTIKFEPYLWDYFRPCSEDPTEGKGLEPNRAMPMMDIIELDQSICYPLYELYCKNAARSTYDNDPTEKALPGNFILSYPDPQAVKEAENLAAGQAIQGTGSNLAEDLTSLSQRNYGNLQGNSVKKIQTGVTGYYLVKPTTSNQFSTLTNLSFDGETWRGDKRKALLGLVDWTKYSSSLAGSDGNKIQADSVLTAKGNPIFKSSLNSVTDPKISFTPDVELTGNFSYDLLTYFRSLGRQRFRNVAEGAELESKIEAYAQRELDLNLKHPYNRFAVVLIEDHPEIPDVIRGLKRIDNVVHSEGTFDNRVDNLILGSRRTPVLNINGEGRSSDDFVILGISSSRSHSLALLSSQVHPLPFHQFVGTEGTRFTVVGKCFSLEAKNKLEQIKNDFDNRVLKSKNTDYSASFNNTSTAEWSDLDETPFMIVENEIFQLMGVNYAIPTQLTWKTVPGSVDIYEFSLDFIDFSPKNKTNELINFLPTWNQTHKNLLNYNYSPDYENPESTNNIHPITLKAMDWFSLQGALINYEIYPDLYLPKIETVNHWISECHKYARAIKTNQPTSEIDPLIREIVDKYIQPIEPLFNFNLELMSNELWWKKFEGTGYVDPDFFYWYCPNDSWGTLFDFVAEDTIGKKNGLSADSGGKLEQRFFDLDFPHATFSSSVQAAASTLTAKQYSEEQLSNLVDTQDVTKSDNILKDYEEQIEEARILGKSQGWWVSEGGISADGEVIFDVKTSALFKENAELPIDNVAQGKESGIPNSQNKELKDSKTLFAKPYQKFWSLEYRQRLLRDFVGVGKGLTQSPEFKDWTNPGFSEGNFLLPAGDFADGLLDGLWKKLFTAETPNNLIFTDDWSLPAESVVFAFADKSNSGWNIQDRQNRSLSKYKDSKGIERPINSLDDWQSYIVDRTKTKTLVGEDPSNLFFEYKPFFLDEFIWSSKNPWLVRCAFVTKNYLTARTNLQFSFQKQGSIHETAIKNYPIFLSIAKQYEVDPNLLLAYFIRRTGLSHSPPTYDKNEIGFGGWDNRVTNVTDPVESIELFAKKLKEYQDRYHYTSIALLLADYDLSGAKLNNLNNLDYEAILKVVADANVENYPSLLKSAFNKGLPNQVLDGTYMCWLEVSRVIGFVDIGKPVIDPYFSIKNPLLVLDIGTNKKGRLVTTDYYPSGVASTAVFRLARNEIKAPYGLVTNPSGFTLDPETALSKVQRIREALFPDVEDAVYGVLLNMRQYSPYGRILGSYPSYVAVFINEGYFYREGSTKLWDTYYIRGNIQGIEVSKSRHDPASYASITLSNVFHQISRYTALEAYLQHLSLEDKERIGKTLREPGQFLPGGRIWDDIVTTEFFKKPTKELIDIYARSYINAFNLSQGARLHLRMGYGSNPAKLPVVFNGTVMNVSLNNDLAVLEAVGDGHELAKSCNRNLSKTSSGWAYNDGGNLFGSGKSPSSIVIEALVNIDFWSNFLAGFVGNNFFRDFSHGIAHFGDVYHDEQAWYPSELHINIYESSLTAMEQDVDAIKNVFEHSAFWDWGHGVKNYFSVSVQEPSTWKIARTCSQAVFDFTTSAEPIMTHSTLFFGKWWWLMNYAYKEDIIDFVPSTELNGVIVNLKNKAPEHLAKLKEIKRLSNKFSANEALNKSGSDLLTDKEIEFIDKTWLQIPEHIRLKSPVKENLFDQILDAIGEGAMAGVSGGRGQSYAPNQPPSKSEIKDKLLLLRTHYLGELNPGPEAAFRDVDFLVSKMYKKPFMQITAITSNLNLLSTNIELQGDLVHTDAIGTYTYNGTLTGDDIVKTSVYSVDDSIVATDRKTLMVDTSLKNTTLQRGWKGVGLAAARWLPGLNQQVNGVPSTQGIHNSVVAGLVDSVKEMYGGTIVTLGLPYLKPQDLLAFSDEKTGLQGILGVKEVVHRLDTDSGLITLITPDCVALPRPSFQGDRIIQSTVIPVAKKVALLWGLKAVGVTAKHAFSTIFSKKSKDKIVDYLYAQYKINYAIDLTKDSPLTNVISDMESRAKRIDSILKSKTKRLKKHPKTLAALEKELDELTKDIEKRKLLLTKLENVIVDLVDGLDEDNEIYDQVRDYSKIERTADAADLDQRIKAEVLGARAKKAAALDDIIQEIQEVTSKDIADIRVKFTQSPIASRLLKNATLQELIEDIAYLTPSEFKNKYKVTIGELKELRTLVRKSVIKMITLSEFREFIKTLKFKNKDLLKFNSYSKSLVEGIVDATVGPYAKVVENLATEVPTVKKKVANIYQPGSFSKIKEFWNQVKVAPTNEAKLDLIEQTLRLAKTNPNIHSTKDVYKAGIQKWKRVSAQVRLGTMATPLGIARDLILFAISAGLVDGIKHNLVSRKAVKIYPLFSSGVPYVAGIRGHQGSVVGDEPSWWDRILTGFLKGDVDTLNKAGLPPQLSSAAIVVSFWIDLNEINVPDWYPSPSDQAYLKAVNAKEILKRE